MSCTTPHPEVQAVLDRICATRSLPVGTVDPTVLALLERYGWVYRWRETLDVTGAGAHHAATTTRWAGMLE